MPENESKWRITEEKRWQQFASAAREALRHNPNLSEAHNNLGVALGHMGDSDAAIAEYREALRANPGNCMAHYNLGVALASRGDWDGAIAESGEAVRLDPELADAHNNLGMALGSIGNWDAAILEFQEAIRLKPSLAEAHDNLGVALTKKGHLDAAIAASREALRLDPKLAGAHLNLGAALGTKGDWQEEIAEYREELRSNPNSDRAHYNLAYLFGSKGKWDGAISEYREALRLNPNLAEAHDNLGSAFANKGDWEGAIAESREALRLNPKLATAHNNIGVALEQKGDRRGAIGHYRRACLLEPETALYKQNYEQLSQQVAAENEESEEWRKAFAGRMNTPEVLAEKGRVLAFAVLACAEYSSDSVVSRILTLPTGSGDKMPPDAHFRILLLLEWVWLYVHVIDSTASEHIGAEKRNLLIGALVDEIAELLRTWAEEGSPELRRLASEEARRGGFKREFWENLNVRQQEYAKCQKWFADDKEAYSGTLIWEFSQRVAALAGREHDPRFYLPVYCQISDPVTLKPIIAAGQILPE